MSRFNTGNPLGSGSPLDLDDNAKNMDEAVNSSQPTFKDRLGNTRMTFVGMANEAGDSSVSLGAAADALREADRAESQADRAEGEVAAGINLGVSQVTSFATQEANRAETARDAAFVNADVYPDVATGRAAVADGEQFQVVQGVEIVRYRRDSSSSQTAVARYPSASIDSLQINRNKNYPFRQRIRGGVLTPGNAYARRSFLGARVIGPRESIEGKYFSIGYLRNGAEPRNDGGIRIEEFDASTFETEGNSTVIHAASDTPLEYTEDSTGVHTFSIRPAHRPEITIGLDIDVSELPSWGSSQVLGNNSSNDGWSFHIDESCHFANPAPISEGVQGLSGIGTMGASLIASPANYWFELSASKLGVTTYNKALSGGGIPPYYADRLWRGNYCTDTEFDDMDVLAIQFAASRDLDDEIGLLEGVEAYTENFDATNSSNQFSANYSDAQCLDYILKYWQKWCFEQKDNTSSKWHGTQHGKPFRVIFVTHWHDAREYYNGPIREVAKRWGAAVCEFDRKIGFSKDTALPNGDQVSVVYGYDTHTIDGVVYGWHPARGSTGEYIQTRMANIFAQSISEWFKQI